MIFSSVESPKRYMNLEQTLLEMFTVWQKGQGKEERKEHRLKRVELKKEELSCPLSPSLDCTP